MNIGVLDVEMTCDGKQQGERFIDDGRMKHSKREIISVGFVVFDEKYAVKTTYSAFVKPARNFILTEYCKNLTGITQVEVNGGKYCNDAFRDILKICRKYSVEIILTFGNADKFGILNSAKYCQKAKQPVENMYIVAQKILDVNPIILDAINQKNVGLTKIANMLQVKNKSVNHNALNDSLLLLKIFKRLNLKISEKES